MKYITTGCSNCGYITRNRESGVPKVQIGAPILRCPKCGHLILDSIQTEYEFMTESERANFSTQTALPNSYLYNILFIVIGLFFFIGGFTLKDEYRIICIVIGVICIALGIIQIVKNHKSARNETIEQAVYESLRRTADMQYVEYISNAYKECGIKRNYTPYANKSAYLEKYGKFELRESYRQSMNDFNQLLESVNVYAPVKQDDNSTLTLH